MNRTNWSITILIIGAVALWGVYTFGNWQNTSADPTSQETSSQESGQDSVEEPTPRNEDLTYTGWIPTWAHVNGYNAVVEEKDLFSDISPVWYEVQENGELDDQRPANYQETINLAEQNDIELIPAIAMFDHELFTNILQNEENLNRHVESIHQTTVNNDYDGIDLDYESTKLSDKEKYFEFLQKLSERLKADEKKLVVTVLAKWGDDVEYPYLPQTREVQDWSKIAQYADEIRIMTYDYTAAGALNPGPIAPLDWMQEVIDYAKTQAEPNKFVLGIHLYSYERWLEVPDTNNNPGFDDPRLQFKEKYFQNNERGQSPARAYNYEVVQRVLDNYEGELAEYQGEKIYRYGKVNEATGIYENRVLVFIDPQGVKDRAELAKQNGLKGVAFWQLGNGSALLLDLE